ncbi:MAG: threonylcarbamoyl-AMP synthase [Planctomycetes bacterium]|nr:threonylcarbamoyl-AMP synthase [Planctomycetota bacterium]
MKTRVLKIDPLEPEADRLAAAADVIRAGGLVAFPTETVYGLGASALNAEACRRIFAAKGRPANNPLIVHVAQAADALPLVSEWPETAERLAQRFWPGPLTLVLPRSQHVPDVVTAGGSTVAVRVPAHPVARGLIEAAGLPIAAPSANPSALISATQAEHVLRGLGGRIELLLDGGPTPGGLESTVLDLTVDPPRLLRPGLVSAQKIESVIGPIAGPHDRPVEISGPLRSPGMQTRHYAPRTPLELTDDDGWPRAVQLAGQGLRVGWLTFVTEPEVPPANLTMVVMPRDPAAYAARLYAVLHALDASDLDRIVVAMPPSGDEWLAVRDRLLRAAAN